MIFSHHNRVSIRGIYSIIVNGNYNVSIRCLGGGIKKVDLNLFLPAPLSLLPLVISTRHENGPLSENIISLTIWLEFHPKFLNNLPGSIAPDYQLPSSRLQSSLNSLQYQVCNLVLSLLVVSLKCLHTVASGLKVKHKMLVGKNVFVF